MGDLPAHDLFVHVRIAIGIVLGLSITRLLAGLARMVQHPDREKVYPLHLAWVFAVLLFVIDFWWWEYALAALPRLTFELFVFLIFTRASSASSARCSSPTISATIPATRTTSCRAGAGSSAFWR